MKRLLLLTPVLALCACQQGGKANNAAAAPANAASAGNNMAAAAPAAEPGANGSANASAPASAARSLPVPASYDWSYLTHGGQADFWFGDGDWAEGDTLLSFSCLPGSREVRLAAERPATLRAQGRTLTMSAEDPTPASHPVLQALKSSGSIAVAEGEGERILTAKAEGRAAVRQFFEYCG